MLHRHFALVAASEWRPSRQLLLHKLFRQQPPRRPLLRRHLHLWCQRQHRLRLLFNQRPFNLLLKYLQPHSPLRKLILRQETTNLFSPVAVNSVRL